MTGLLLAITCSLFIDILICMNRELQKEMAALTTEALRPLPLEPLLRQAALGRPKLFGGRLVDYAASTGSLLPRLVLSCTRVLVRFALHQQGAHRMQKHYTQI